MMVIGHRGAKGYAPENTLAAFERGLACGADALECDIHLSKDDHLIVMHDERVDRTTNGTGFIRDQTLSELKGLQIEGGQSVLTLEELLEWSKSKPNVGLVIELKQGSKPYPMLVKLTVEAIQKYEIVEKSILISFDLPKIKEAKELLPQIKTGALFYKKESSPEQMIQATKLALADAVMPSVYLLTPKLVSLSRSESLKIYTWTANHPSEIQRAIDLGIDGITSDYPDRVKELILNIQN